MGILMMCQQTSLFWGILPWKCGEVINRTSVLLSFSFNRLWHIHCLISRMHASILLMDSSKLIANAKVVSAFHETKV